MSAQNTISLPTGVISNLKSVRVSQLHCTVLTPGYHTLFLDMQYMSQNYYYDGVNNNQMCLWSGLLNSSANQDYNYVNIDSTLPDSYFVDGKTFSTFYLNVYAVDKYNNIVPFADISQQNRLNVEIVFGDNGLI